MGAADEIEVFRSELLGAVHARLPETYDATELDFAFVCEVGARLTDAEELQEFVPSHYRGTGGKNRKIRVDAYEIDDADDSVRLLIADFRGDETAEVLTKTRTEALFASLQGFLEESVSGRIWSSAGEAVQTRELSGMLQQKHEVRIDGSRGITRYRLYLITDSVLSDRLKDLPTQYLDGVPVEFHIWDVSRLMAVSGSIRGTEELEIDFQEFVAGGLPCLRASQTVDFDGYLCVIGGAALAELYDRYGSRLLEGNVRSFLSTSAKINRGMQGTIRSEPDRFFAYNNGISATATSATIEDTDGGPRLVSARYLQIVNGGQTTASLHAAMRKDRADLEDIHVQMKLSVVKASESDMLDTMIQKIARFSNSQTKVSDADFFSNHPFHRAIERHSRMIKAPAAEGAQFNTFWFYERNRGQYLNAQSKMTISQKKNFLRENPRIQLISKTDLAKFENSWRRLPHIVSRGSQKNFLAFAEWIGKEYGENGIRFDNEMYFKEMVAHAILFRSVEKMVSQAKSTWYGGDYRAQIVTYTIAKLADMIDRQAPGWTLNQKAIWVRQGLSPGLALQIETIAKAVAGAITAPPIANMNVGEWCKKEDCWEGVRKLEVPLLPDLESDLLSATEAMHDQKDARGRGAEDAIINAVLDVVKLQASGCWTRLDGWAKRHAPLYGTEADLVRNATRKNWIPQDRQAATLMKTLRRLEQEGFRADGS